MEEKDIFDTYQAEQNEANVLIEKGVKFTVKKQSFLKYFSKNKERNFFIEQPFLGTLDIISALFLSINFDEKLLDENFLAASKELVSKSVKTCALVVAVSVLNSKLKIKLFSKILAQYFLWRMRPSDLVKMSIIIHKINNYGDFINSIRLMSAIRTTAPQNLIEENQAA